MLLAFLCVIGSVALAWMLLENAHSAAHADPAVQETYVPAFDRNFEALPWGLAFDTSGHVWVAEPQCDADVNTIPICSNTIPGGILEYTRQGFSNSSQPLQKFQVPQGYSSPFFLAFDTAGDLWFTEPVTNAIGELDTSNNWHQWKVPTNNASPFDLTFDQYGHLWFTELGANKIGVFDPSTGKIINEYPTPTSGSRPYGITGPDPTSQSIWFTENSGLVHQIGRISPNADGTINGGIQEYHTSLNSQAITPHSITYDNQGNIWWSEGTNGTIGQLVIGKAKNGTSQGVTEYAVPQPCQGCSIVHISGIAVDSNGTVWFDDSLNSRYGSFVPSTSTFSMYVLDECITSGSHPHDGLAIDSNNNVWISEEFGDKLVEALPGTITSPTPCPSSTNTPTPTGTTMPTSSVPVSPTWYFAEGKVGQGFTEFLTIQNPDPVNACAVSIQYLLSNSTLTPRAITIPPNTRYTEGVDSDLNTPANSSASQAISTIVTVTNNSTCKGVVAERPIYFTNFRGVSSGTDVLGATHTGTDFYFADVSSLPGYNSFITILNPPNGVAATITASYYGNGTQLGTDTLTVQPGTRGTIIPKNFGQRVATRVHSSAQVVVERPTYFTNYSVGNAHNVYGAASVVGAAAPATDWRFAEGYTGGQFQENLVLGNFGMSPASGTLVLEYDNGSTLTAPVSVNAQDVVILDVNAITVGRQGACSPASCILSQSVSAEITLNSGAIVAEREMFYHYNHSDRVTGLTTNAQGGTDVTGQSGTATVSAYSFAEGYTNAGFDEWLTVQNPTTNQETVWVTLVNGKSNTYQFSMVVGGHTRATVNVDEVVVQHLLHPNDGVGGYEVSMTVQTTDGSVFVAERPMYWNYSGTQGGSDVIGYIGG
jgi:virginiamycin B lyase